MGTTRVNRFVLASAAVVGALSVSLASLVGLRPDAGAISPPLPVASAGAIDVVAPLGGFAKASVPIVLSAASTTPVTVGFHFTAITALSGRDWIAPTGEVTFQPGTIEQWVPVAVPHVVAGTNAPCFFDYHSQCRTFQMALSAVTANVTVDPTPSVDSIIEPASSAAATFDVGDAYVKVPSTGHQETLQLPITLLRPTPTNVTVTLAFQPLTALFPVDFTPIFVKVVINAGSVSSDVPVVVRPNASGQSSELFKMSASIAGYRSDRVSGTGVMIMNQSGAVATAPTGFSSATLSQDVNARTNVADRFTLTGDTNSVVARGSLHDVAGNTRAIFWRSADGAPREVCATWAAQSPDQSKADNQEGVVLDIANQDGVVRALTVTKSIYGYDPWRFNVHLWNTMAPVPFRLLAYFELAPNLPVDLPWDICARLTGTQLQFVVWSHGAAMPAWGTTALGGTVSLPASSVLAGPGGWYVGHLPPGGTISYEGLTAGALGVSFEGHAT